jgi:hypothetical protein
MVAETNVRHQTIIEELQRRSTWNTLVIADVHDTTIRPPTDRLVGRKYVEVENVKQ